MINRPVRTRIAPTPSGFLHIGNLYSFVLTWLVAKRQEATVLLRIDDLDAERMRPEYIEDIFRVLDFIGMAPDEGPSGTEDFLRNYSQKNRVDYYGSFLKQLANGGWVYACTCSRKQILALGANGRYPGTCRNLGLGLNDPKHAWRLGLPAGSKVEFYDDFCKETATVDLTGEMGDFVVRRKGGAPAYQLSSLADDLFYNINLVVRGRDLTVSTAAQLKLAEILKLEQFSGIKWLHHPLITNNNGEKLSKSAGDTSIKRMIEQGASRASILTRLGFMLFGKEIAVSSLSEMLEIFRDRPFANRS